MNENEYVEPVQKYLFLLLYAEKEQPIKANIWLQKEMFLVSRNIKDLMDEFDSYLLGPFSEAVDEYADQLRISGYIKKDKDGWKLTEKGRKAASKLWENADTEVKKIVADAKVFLNDMSEDELLVFIYSTFEKYTDESEIKEKVDKKRQEISISLFKKHKISLERAATIAKLSTREFISLLKAKDIPIYEYTDEELREELLGSEARSP